MSKDDTATIRKIATLKRESTQQHFEVLEFEQVGGESVQRQYPRKLFGSLPELRKRLLDDGAVLPGDEQDRKDLFDRLIYEDAPAHGLLLEATGWYREIGAFVLPDRILPDGAADQRYWLDQEWRRIAPPKVVGTFAGWQKQIAKPAARSSRLMFALSAGLAASILPFASHDSFGINFFGPSRRGKSTILRAVRTLIGDISPHAILTWNLTSAGFGEEAPKFNDLVMLIDEVAASDSGSKASPVTSGAFAYIIAGGTDKRRHSSFQEKHGGGGSWRTIVLSTNERSLDEEVWRVRKEPRRAGERIRFIDVPATSTGYETIFDRLPKDLTGADRQGYGSEQLIALNRACSRHAGHALPMYIEWLLAREKELVRKVETLMDELMSAVGAGTGDLVVESLARAMAVVYAGGALGIEAGVLPWKRALLLGAIRSCYKGARRQLGDEESLAKEGLASLWKNLSKPGVVATWPQPGEAVSEDVRRAEAYRRKRDGRIEYAVHAKLFRRLLDDAHQRELVLKALRREKLVKMDGNNPMSQPQILGRKDKRRFLVVWRELPTQKPAKGSSGQATERGAKKRP